MTEEYLFPPLVMGSASYPPVRPYPSTLSLVRMRVFRMAKGHWYFICPFHRTGTMTIRCTSGVIAHKLLNTHTKLAHCSSASDVNHTALDKICLHPSG